MTFSIFARKCALALALAVAANVGALDATRAANPEDENAATQTSANASELDDSTPIVGRKLVKLNRPIPATRKYVPLNPREALPGQEEEPAALDAEPAALEVVGREIVDFRFQDGKGRYMLEDENGMIRVFPQSAIESVEDARDTTLGELRAKMTDSLQREFGDNFRTLSTARYLFVSDASEGYVKWCARLFDSLDDAFQKYSRRRKIELDERVEPLVVVIFAKRADFVKYASVETDAAATALSAYYSMQSNRVALYDLSEAEGNADATTRRKRSTVSETREFLSRPNAAYNVATIVHEATHQLAFNEGVFKRSGPVALWLVEGLSLVFETPSSNLRQNGWVYRGAFPTNERMKALFDARFNESKLTFKDVVEQDKFYADIETSYAASWALCYYLEKKRPSDLAKYVRLLQEKQACTVYSKEDRVADFEQCFGDNWEKLTKNVQTFVRKL